MLGLSEPKGYDEEQMEKEMEDEQIINILGGDRDSKGNVSWQKFISQRLKNMANSKEQLRAYNTILQSIRSADPKRQRLFFLEGILKMLI